MFEKSKVPSVDELVRGLSKIALCPRLADAQLALAEVNSRLEVAVRRKADDAKEADRLAGEVAFGRATAAEVEAAIVRSMASDRLIPGFERAREEAKRRLAEADEEACRIVHEEARAAPDEA